MQDKLIEDVVFFDIELNDLIEWLELKDLFFEFVMELFEKIELEDDVLFIYDKVVNKEKMEQKKVIVYEILEKLGKN